jgi:hypothetical protein
MLAAEADRLIDDLLDARHVRGERRDDDAPGARAKMFANASPTMRSEGVCPGRSALVESESMHSTPSSPTPRDRREVGRAAVDRRLVELEVAGVEDRAEFGVIASAQAPASCG